ncbi:putative endoplasmic reticulum membrane protein [Escovopsis weberi]|uniref:Putative endoplasmic reticulum membrane protein n=1 Tax=Escovopsis weberi TaxID=150374 RepID=A0A0M9VSZ8_ESCWE|nr:putative endoplasmic reticulum membrane protein [Escovopsis weberi]
MKPALGFLAALATCAAAAQPVADVFILPRPDASLSSSSSSSSSTATTTPSLSRSLTRLLLLQRLAHPGKGPFAKDIPSGLDLEEVASALNSFGKTLPPLFGDDQPEEPRQLVLMLEGLTEKQIKDTAALLKVQPSFTISNPPSAGAHKKLATNDFYNAGVTNEHDCGIDDATNPFKEECWSGKSTVARYSVGKNSEILSDLVGRFSMLESLARKGEMETAILLLPAVSESSKSSSWSDKPQELRRRQFASAEQVITSFGGASSSSAAPTQNLVDGSVFRPRPGAVPACFSSLESCKAGTGSCSQQGQCVDRFASSKAENSEVCFSCHCMSTRAGENGTLTHWAGPTCAKKDISVPFWLFAGFALLLIGTLSLATSMLYSVGEERLPGVIGAGVSKSK